MARPMSAKFTSVMFAQSKELYMEARTLSDKGHVKKKRENEEMKESIQEIICGGVPDF